ncbi:acyltransferase [Flavobacterium urumqiense]|uniref:Putative colanic acid biosynthesis acetyltransferase WcaF n=1 Tax=Flavobacterium urumqiense TaxID=935224 RepID=A0A1H5Y4X4_9FLAO|nr:acetyltransferase [Flavobacterium urumqiense]SEG18586.1 putative colanic acid biosynthesis acetyltransferase WcaF [Flavobacterium urumqiense]
MASLKYLWGNRSKNLIFSRNFFISWAKRLFTINKLLSNNLRRKRLIKQGAHIADTAEIGITKIGGRKCNLTVGEFTFLGRVEIALHEKITIGNYVCINDGVKLLSASHDVSDSLWRHKKSPIYIGDYAWIATNAIVLPGVKIGRGAVVGAGAVVSKDVNDYSIVIGNPAQEIAKKRTKTLNYNPCEFLAANNAWLK